MRQMAGLRHAFAEPRLYPILLDLRTKKRPNVSFQANLGYRRSGDGERGKILLLLGSGLATYFTQVVRLSQ